MLRPQSNRFIGSTRAERRRNIRREKARAVGAVFEGLQGVGLAISAGSSAIVLLFGLPLLYAASSFLVLAIPMRWMTGRAPVSLFTGCELIVALAIALAGIFRAVRGAEPVAPVRPVFARTMLGLSWIGAAMLVVADIWGTG